MKDTIIFDWDGTLHNTKHLYGEAFRTAYAWLVAQGYAPERYYSDDDVSIYLGMNAKVMWNTFMPQLSQEAKERCSSMIGAQMTREIYQGKAVLYDGSEDILGELKRKGHRLVFLSNCKHAYMQAHREVFSLDRFFDGFYCCQDYDFIPKEEIFPAIAEAFDGPYIVIGDRASDLKIAQVHKFPSIGCSYGFGTREELSIADAIADHIKELPGLVELLRQKSCTR